MQPCRARCAQGSREIAHERHKLFTPHSRMDVRHGDVVGKHKWIVLAFGRFGDTLFRF